MRPNAEPADLQWKYWQDRADWPGPRSFVLTHGEEILAHAAVIPGRCWSGARHIRTLHMIDWAARPSATGAGVSLMKHLRQSTDALLAIGGSAQTLKLLPHLNFQSWGKVATCVRPLRPLGILTRSPRGSRNRLPRTARAVLWNIQAPSGRTDGWNVRRVMPGESALLAEVLPAPTQQMAVLERAADLFEYALQCPISPMALYALEKDGRVRGYFLLAFVLRQARLADCWIDSDNASDWHALIHCAVRQAKKNSEAVELAAWASDPWFSRCLLECGFHQRGELPVQVFSRGAESLPSAPLRVQMLDNDAAYRHGGVGEFWS